MHTKDQLKSALKDYGVALSNIQGFQQAPDTALVSYAKLPAKAFSLHAIYLRSGDIILYGSNTKPPFTTLHIRNKVGLNTEILKASLDFVTSKVHTDHEMCPNCNEETPAGFPLLSCNHCKHPEVLPCNVCPLTGQFGFCDWSELPGCIVSRTYKFVQESDTADSRPRDRNPVSPLVSPPDISKTSSKSESRTESKSEPIPPLEAPTPHLDSRDAMRAKLNQGLSILISMQNSLVLISPKTLLRGTLPRLQYCMMEYTTEHLELTYPSSMPQLPGAISSVAFSDVGTFLGLHSNTALYLDDLLNLRLLGKLLEQYYPGYYGSSTILSLSDMEKDYEKDKLKHGRPLLHAYCLAAQLAFLDGAGQRK